MYKTARRGLTRTFQQSMYFPSGTVRGNLTMAVDIARATGRHDRHANLPTTVDGLIDFAGLRSLAENQSSTLGHGQLRQLGLALALATEPKLLLLDEPAAGLSDTEAETLATTLQLVRQSGVTIVVVDHDMGFVLPLVDRVIILSAGKKLLEGSPSVVRNDPRVIEVYLGSGLAAGRRVDDPAPLVGPTKEQAVG
jgi:branched-chain amino acid transport system ATP-binding protein